MKEQVTILDTDKRNVAVERIESTFAPIITAIIDRHKAAIINVNVNDVSVLRIEVTVRYNKSCIISVYDNDIDAYTYSCFADRLNLSRLATLIFLSSSSVYDKTPIRELIFSFDF